MSQIFSALGKTASQGQNAMASALDRNSAAKRATTDEDHYVSAVERAAQAASQNVIDGDNKEEVSAFVQNQYLINKTNGKRDLGDQYFKHGVSSQLGAADGLTKTALAGLKPVQVGDQTLLYGADKESVEYITRIDEDGNEVIATDEQGRPMAKNVESANANDTVLIAKPNFDIAKKEAENGPLKTTTKGSVEYTKAANDAFKTAFKAGEEGGPAQIIDLISKKRDLSQMEADLANYEGDELEAKQEEVNILKGNIKKLTSETQDKMKTLAKRGFVYNEVDGTFLYRAGTGKMKWKNAKGDEREHTIDLEEEYDPLTDKSDVYFSFNELEKGKKVPLRLSPEEMRAYVDKKAGSSAPNVYKRFNEKFNFTKEEVESSLTTVQKKYKEGIESAFSDGLVTLKEASEMLGPDAAKYMWDSQAQATGSAIENMNTKIFNERMKELTKLSAQDIQTSIPGGGADLKKISAMQNYLTQREHESSAMTNKGKTSVNVGAEKQKIYQEAIVNNNNIANETTKRAMNELLAVANLQIGENTNYKIRINPDSSIWVTAPNGNVSKFSQEKLKSEDTRSTLKRLLLENKEIKSKLR